MVKYLVNYFYMEGDGYDQSHKEFMVKLSLFGTSFGLVTFLITL